MQHFIWILQSSVLQNWVLKVLCAIHDIVAVLGKMEQQQRLGRSTAVHLLQFWSLRKMRFKGRGQQADCSQSLIGKRLCASHPWLNV